MLRGELQSSEGCRVFEKRQAVTVAAPPSRPLVRSSFELELEKAAPAWAYPSPPMSRSSASPRETQDAADHGYGASNYSSKPQHARGGAAVHQSLGEPLTQVNEQPSRHHPLERRNRMSYGYQRPAQFPNRPLSYPGHNQQSLSSTAQQGYVSIAGSRSTTTGFPTTSSTFENQSSTSPKSQRKIKGHVASACVPCKRAHLRCDAQRPCSRCTSNGKEDACIDVQHKKRGRPRLRDDRETRYDLSKPPPSYETGSRRPLSIYTSTSTSSAGYDIPLQHEDPYRAIKSQPKEPFSASYSSRGLHLSLDATAYSKTVAQQLRYPEAVAYLSLDLEFAKASDAFVKALAGLRPERQQLLDLVVSADRDRIISLQHHLVAEQKQLEPNYLPPILGRGDQIFQTLGFTGEDVSRYLLDYEDYLTFVGADGRTKQYLARLGLARERSFYFVVMLLDMHPRPPLASSSLNHHGASQTFYSLGTPNAAPLQPQDRRLGQSSLPPRLGAHMLSSLHPGVPARGSSFVTSSLSEPLHPTSSSVPHNESNSQVSQGNFQLPPIRPPPVRRHDAQNWPGQSQQQQQQYPPRDERQTRVDIGGLIEKPEDAGYPH